MKKQLPASFYGGNFNTLAQTGTTFNFQDASKLGIILHGTGSDLLNSKAIKGRAKRKQISQVLSIGLVEIAQNKGNRKLEKTFWNTYHCFNTINASEGRIYGKYCKNRLCLVCLSIRKAEIVNKYLPVIRLWQNPYFVTLTVKAVAANKLNKVISSMVKGLSKIIEKYKKRNQRGTGKNLIGIRSLECNFNPVKKTYNPHFHLIVSDEETGNIFIEEWLKNSKKGWTTRGAQNIQKVHNSEKCLIEVVKYGSKIFTEPDITKKANQHSKRTVYLAALYTIVEAMQGKRLFDRFGFNLPPKSDKSENQSVQTDNYTKYEFDAHKTDWIEVSTNKPLSEYKSNPKVRYLLENCINKELC